MTIAAVKTENRIYCKAYVDIWDGVCYNSRRNPCLRQVFAVITARASPGCDIDGLAKMPLRASIFASWYNSRRNPCLRQVFAALAARALPGCDIDVLAKMPLRASIFASWYCLLKTVSGGYSKLWNGDGNVYESDSCKAYLRIQDAAF